MTPAELLTLIDDYGRRMLHIGSLPGSAHGRPTGNESEEAKAVYAKIKEAVEQLVPDNAAYRRPPADVLAKPLTHQVVAEYPDWFLSGPGREQAERTQCAHGYNLTDSCPGCDADDEAAGHPFV